MGCGCKKKIATNKEKLEKEKKIREAMREFMKHKSSNPRKVLNSKSGKS
jgi:hypothetical protein|tara:strand:+ start:51 stop:197 length:147 start_codon:yes stop_codon:yes gene_type:complete